MFQFNFENKKIISRNISSYPILLADVKARSKFYLENPTDTDQDSYVVNFIIPSVIKDWELSTKFLLLDQLIQAYIPNIQYINSNSLEMKIENLNIREVDFIKYYPQDWNESDARITLDPDFYLVTEEIMQIPSKIKIKKENLPISLFNIQNNFQIQYQVGYLGNDFTNLPQQIKDALAMQAATIIDIRNGYCEDFYSTLIQEAYAEYTIEQQLISFI